MGWNDLLSRAASYFSRKLRTLSEIRVRILRKERQSQSTPTSDSLSRRKEEKVEIGERKTESSSPGPLFKRKKS
jgi:hypothetical protein